MTKRSGLPTTSNADTNQPTKFGGFVIDSDEDSDAEGSPYTTQKHEKKCPIEPKEEEIAEASVPVTSPAKNLSRDGSKIIPSLAPPSSKGVDLSRLRMLLARKNQALKGKGISSSDKPKGSGTVGVSTASRQAQALAHDVRSSVNRVQPPPTQPKIQDHITYGRGDTSSAKRSRVAASLTSRPSSTNASRSTPTTTNKIATNTSEPVPQDNISCKPNSISIHSPPKKPIAITENKTISKSVTAMKKATSGFATSNRRQNIQQTPGSTRVPSGLFQGIRQSDEQHGANLVQRPLQKGQCIVAGRSTESSSKQSNYMNKPPIANSNSIVELPAPSKQRAQPQSPKSQPAYHSLSSKDGTLDGLQSTHTGQKRKASNSTESFEKERTPSKRPILSAPGLPDAHLSTAAQGLTQPKVQNALRTKTAGLSSPTKISNPRTQPKLQNLIPPFTKTKTPPPVELSDPAARSKVNLNPTQGSSASITVKARDTVPNPVPSLKPNSEVNILRANITPKHKPSLDASQNGGENKYKSMQGTTHVVPHTGNSQQIKKVLPQQDTSAPTYVKAKSPSNETLIARENESTTLGEPVPEPMPQSTQFKKASTPTFALTTTPKLPLDAESYFEYAIFQKTWSQNESEDEVAPMELITRPFTNIEDANTQAAMIFKNARQQYRQFFQMPFSEWNVKLDEAGCSVIVGTYASIEDPSATISLKIWVRRDHVSAYSGATIRAFSRTDFIAKTVYVLRLFRLVSLPGESDAEMSEDTKTTARVYSPLPCTECYTSLNAANRAAKNVQIKLSHEKNPKMLAKHWQDENLAELNKRASAMETAEAEEDKYWKSQFKGAGLSSTEFELIVENVGLCGPRNL